MFLFPIKRYPSNSGTFKDCQATIRRYNNYQMTKTLAGHVVNDSQVNDTHIALRHLHKNHRDFNRDASRALFPGMMLRNQHRSEVGLDDLEKPGMDECYFEDSSNTSSYWEVQTKQTSQGPAEEDKARCMIYEFFVLQGFIYLFSAKAKVASTR